MYDYATVLLIEKTIYSDAIIVEIPVGWPLFTECVLIDGAVNGKTANVSYCILLIFPCTR